MSKLLKLKNWLTLEESAAHISSVLGEPVTTNDLYRFALDGHLTLSVNFVNHACARKGEWVKTEDIEFNTIDISILTGEKFEVPYQSPTQHEIHVSDDNWIRLEERVVSIEGIWDLPMIGAERLDIEHAYQLFTSGIEVTLGNIDGAFVQNGDVICQLQTDFDNNQYQEGSTAQKEDIERHIAINKLDAEEAKKLREKFKIDREQYLKVRRERPRDENYFPSGSLSAHDYAVVVRTQEITRFIQSLQDTSAPEKPLTSKERNSLLVLIGALCKEVDIDPNKRGVSASLVTMTEILGAPLTDDTIRKILGQIDDAVSARNK